MIAIGFALLLPSLIYSSGVLAWLARKQLALTFWIAVAACEFVATLLFAKLILYWCGFVDKL